MPGAEDDVPISDEELEAAAEEIEVPIPEELLASPEPDAAADQLTKDIWFSRRTFRLERLSNPVKLYKAASAAALPHVRDVVTHALKILDLEGPPVDLAWALHKDRQSALRYLTAPPISEDDLVTLAETTIAPTPVSANDDAARRIRLVLRHFLDHDRLPWIAKGTAPTADDIELATVATSLLIATRRVETARRGEGSKLQEKSVKTFLLEHGFKELKRKSIDNIRDAPGPGEFMPECIFGGTRADFLIGTMNRRSMAIECKSSNSAVNSYKRLVHEAGNKASTWSRRFAEEVASVAVIAGVYKRDNIEAAMAKGLKIVWAHRLEDLKALLAIK